MSKDLNNDGTEAHENSAVQRNSTHYMDLWYQNLACYFLPHPWMLVCLAIKLKLTKLCTRWQYTTKVQQTSLFNKIP